MSLFNSLCLSLIIISQASVWNEDDLQVIERQCLHLHGMGKCHMCVSGIKFHCFMWNRGQWTQLIPASHSELGGRTPHTNQCMRMWGWAWGKHMLLWVPSGSNSTSSLQRNIYSGTWLWFQRATKGVGNRFERKELLFISFSDGHEEQS